MATQNPAYDKALSLAQVQGPTHVVDWLPILPTGFCLAVAAVLMMLRLKPERHSAIALPALGVTVLLQAWLLVHVALFGPQTVMMGRWLAPFGIAFSVDLMGAAFALGSGIVGLSIGVYALIDIGISGRRYGFYPVLMVVMAASSGAFLTGDVFNLYVWFEVLLIASFALLILGSERAQIDGALKYAVLNLLATTLFLLTIAYLYGIFGTLNMADLALEFTSPPAGAPLMTLALLFTLAFGIKAAAFPVNFWLPAAYHTPRIVVSALFGALLTKVGIYSLLRVVVMIMPLQMDALRPLLSLVAALTMVMGALGMLAQNDLRRFLGFFVIYGIGNMLAGIAIGAVQGLSASLFYAFQSMIVTAALYMAIGQAGRLGRSFQMHALGGLYARSPAFSLLTLCLFFAASGLPPFSGFWPKVMLVKAAFDATTWWLAAVILMASFAVLIAFGRLFILCFWREEGEVEKDDKSPYTAQERLDALKLPAVLPLLLMSGLVVWVGLLPQSLLDLCQNAAIGLLAPETYIHAVFAKGAGL